MTGESNRKLLEIAYEAYMDTSMVVLVKDVIATGKFDSEDEVYIGLINLEENGLIETRSMNGVHVQERDDGTVEATGSIGYRPRYNLTALGEDYCTRILHIGTAGCEK